MADFNKYAPKLKRWEGGYANDPDDTGKQTQCGVTLATFQQFFGADKAEADLRRMTEAQWRTIMKGGFWDKCQADMIHNQSVAECIVDWCVNSGPAIIKKVQGIVGVKADGVVGPQTLRAINNYDGKKLHYRVKAARLAWLVDCVERRSVAVKWFDGWINRVASFCYQR